MMDSISFRRKALFAAGVGVFFMVCVILLNYTFISFQNSGDGTVSVRLINDSGDEIKQFEVEKGKTIFVKRTSYKIQVNGENKQSIYNRSFGFIYNSQKLELFPQKKSQYVATAPHSCIKEEDAGSFLFYPCGPYTSGSVIVSEEKKQITRSLPVEEADEEDQIDGGVMAKTKDGLIVGDLIGDNLYISEYLKPSNNSSISVFGDVFNYDNFITNPNSSAFAVYNYSTNELSAFSGLNDNNPKKYTIPEKFRSGEGLYRFALTDENIYIFSLHDNDIHNGELNYNEEDKKQTSENKKQVVLVLSASDLSLVKEMPIPETWALNYVVPNQKNKVLFSIRSIDKAQVDEVYVIDGAAKYKKIALDGKSFQLACWADENTLYYSADAGKNIYRHSFDGQASFLVYGGLNETKNIAGIQCEKGALYIMFDGASTRRVDVNDESYGYSFYKLIDQDYPGGLRPETVLPLFVNVEDHVYKASQSKNGVKIEVVYPGNRNVSKEQIERSVLEEFRNSGVNTGGISFSN